MKIDVNAASADPLYQRDADTVSAENAREMLRLAEVRHEAMFRAALGMDQRAAVLAAGFSAAAGALAAAAISSSTWGAAAFGTAVALALAAGLAAWVCRPQKSSFPGIMPMMWHVTEPWLTDQPRDLALSLAASLQDRLAAAEKAQARNGRLLWAALLVAAFSPLAGLAGHSVSIIWIYGMNSRTALSAPPSAAQPPLTSLSPRAPASEATTAEPLFSAQPSSAQPASAAPSSQ